MMINTKFLSSLSPLELEWLLQIEDSPLESKLTQNRSQAIRLSHLGFSIAELCKICKATRKTVSRWIDRLETHKFESLKDAPRSGRPLILPEEHHPEIIALVKAEPRQLKSALSQIEGRFNTKLSVKTLKRIIKKNCAGSALENL